MSGAASWDDQAATFDEAPDHGLRDPRTREAWRRLLVEHLPAPPAEVVDLGCGTGSLSVLLGEQGHLVRGLDLSPAMVARARAKAAAVLAFVKVTNCLHIFCCNMQKRQKRKDHSCSSLAMKNFTMPSIQRR